MHFLLFIIKLRFQREKFIQVLKLRQDQEIINKFMIRLIKKRSCFTL